MARYTGPRLRISRRFNTAIFGPSKYSDRKDYPPGQHGQGRTRFSDYGVQLREKQKVKRMYGLLERQFAATMKKASSMKGRAGENLLMLLERRLDNVVFRMGFATSRAEARQLVKHGHFLVNGKKATIPSMLLRPPAVVTLREKSHKVARSAGALEALESRSLPQWLEIDKDNFAGKLATMPVRDDITMPIQEQLIVELYSR